MANIELYGTWLNVPYVDLPKVGGGKARLWDGIKMGVLRKDAELVKTWSNDSLIVHDDGVTLPAYATSATTIVASADLTGTYTLDYTNYDYYILIRALAIPVYNTSTPAKTRNEYAMLSGAYEVVSYPASTFKSLVGNKTYATRSGTTQAVGANYRMLYWSSTSAVTVYTATTYGISQVIVAPSISSGVVTAKSPTLQFRGSSTYLTQAVYETVTDIRRQFVIEVWRTKKGDMNLDGWGIFQQGMHIVDCVNSSSHNLT